MHVYVYVSMYVAIRRCLYIHVNTYDHPKPFLITYLHNINQNQALANTYAAAYYLFAPSNGGEGAENPLAARLTLFEDKQQRLEQEVRQCVFVDRCSLPQTRLP